LAAVIPTPTRQRRKEEVAAHAGVSKGTLYLYYPSKEELFKAVVRNNVSSLIAEGAEIARQFEGPTPELLALLLRTWWERFGSQPASGICKIMIAEVRNFPEIAQFYVDEVIIPAHRLLGGAIERGMRSGEFRKLPVDEVVHALVAPLIFMSLHAHSFGCCPVHGLDYSPDSVLTTQIDMVLKGLEVRPGAVPPEKGSRR
jgi:AcrR family transcriptional regulator